MNRQTRTLFFTLNLSHAECLLYYKGYVRQIMVTTEDNQRIQFPAQFIQRFVSENGVHGRFQLVFNAENKLISLVKVV